MPTVCKHVSYFPVIVTRLAKLDDLKEQRFALACIFRGGQDFMVERAWWHGGADLMRNGKQRVRK